MKIRSFSNFDEFMAGDDDSYATHLKNINGLIPAKEEDFTVPGFSFPANQFVDFHVDFNYGPGFPEVNWRERLVCPITGLNNRLRAATMMIEFFGNVMQRQTFILTSRQRRYSIFYRNHIRELLVLNFSVTHMQVDQ